jgi:hypothetical protein
MALVDGGVYDNMADQWALGSARRNTRWSPSPGFEEPDELIVVNSSAPMGWSSLGKLAIPLVGEWFTFRRDVNVLYDNTTTPRRRLLHTIFVNAVSSGKGTRGAVVQISQSPFDVPSSFDRPSANDPLALRARAVLAALAGSEGEWAQITRDNCQVKTTLSRIRSPKAERLIRHGYVLAQANLHVLLDYPLLPMPPADRFKGYVGG